tara:strand:- start:5 stop:295 length:291 start_codon:yes stop_codon:yes gene_type:complete
MLTEALPIDIFVSVRFAERPIQKIIDEWRIEAGDIQKIIVTHFKEMGIYQVEPRLEASTMEFILFLLENSPEIVRMIEEMRQQEKKRQISRRLREG